MSREVEQGKAEEERTVLRRSKRRRNRTIVRESDSTEVESDTEAHTGWDIGELIEGDTTVIEKDNSETPESESSSGTFSTTAQFIYNHPWERHSKEMSSNKDPIDKDERSKISHDSGLGRTPEVGMGDFLKWLAEDQQRNREEAVRREERYRDDQVRRDNEARLQREAQQKLMEAMMARAGVRDVPPPTPAVRLPTLSEGGSVEIFIEALETALKAGAVPMNQWKRHLVSNISQTTLAKVGKVLLIEDATYDEVVAVLREGVSITFCSAAEDLSSGEKGKVFETDIRTAAAKMTQLLLTVARRSNDMKEMAEKIAVARLRDHLVPPLKMYVDTGRRFEMENFVCGCEEWVRSQPGEVSCFKKPRISNNTSFRGAGTNYSQGSGSQYKQRPNCFACGKPGHIARECRSRPPVVEAATARRSEEG